MNIYIYTYLYVEKDLQNDIQKHYTYIYMEK